MFIKKFIIICNLKKNFFYRLLEELNIFQIQTYLNFHLDII